MMREARQPEARQDHRIGFGLRNLGGVGVTRRRDEGAQGAGHISVSQVDERLTQRPVFSETFQTLSWIGLDRKIEQINGAASACWATLMIPLTLGGALHAESVNFKQPGLACLVARDLRVAAEIGPNTRNGRAQSHNPGFERASGGILAAVGRFDILVDHANEEQRPALAHFLLESGSLSSWQICFCVGRCRITGAVSRFVRA